MVVQLSEPSVRDAGKALVARLRGLAAEMRRKPAEARLFFHQNNRHPEAVELNRAGDAGDAAADDEDRMIVVSSHCARQLLAPAGQERRRSALPDGKSGRCIFFG